MSRELLKRALNALHDECVPNTVTNAILIKEIQEELVKPEPVAWLYKGDSYFDGKDWHETLEATTCEKMAKFKNGELIEPIPLYTHPPAQQKPLTDDEIIEIGIETRTTENHDFLPVSFARAIEKAHGIGINQSKSSHQTHSEQS